MRIDLSCNFEDKDTVKSLGAKWDTARKTWYIVDMEDLTPFMRWIPDHRANPGAKPGGSITLREYLAGKYTTGAKALTFSAAKAFRVPYPLERGWHEEYANNAITLEAMNDIKRKVGSKRKNTLKKREDKTASKKATSPSVDSFLKTPEWLAVRMATLKKYRPVCQCCGSATKNGVAVDVFHIKPRRIFPHLALDPSNLQVLCDACGVGRGEWDITDFRGPVVELEA